MKENRCAKRLFIPLLFLLCGPLLFSQTIPEVNLSGVVGSGARAWGMGGAFLSVADDATAASWNPGGLGQLENPEFSLVTRFQNYRLTVPSAIHNHENWFRGAQDLEASSSGIEFASFTYPFKIGGVKLVPQFSYHRAISSISRLTSNRTVWIGLPDYRRDPYLYASKMFIYLDGEFVEDDSMSGGADNLSFSLGTRLRRGLHLGISVNYWFNGFNRTMTRTFSGGIAPATDPQALQQGAFVRYQKNHVEMSGFNYNLGLLLDITRQLKFGLVYKSSFTPDVKYTVVNRLETPYGQTMVPESRDKGEAVMKFPMTWGAGFSYRPIDTLTLAVDYTWSQWSKSIIHGIKYLGVERNFYFPSFYSVDPELKFEPEDTQLDTQQIRLGAEYVVVGKTILLPLRFGIFRDSQYFPNSSGKKIYYYGITGGIGLKWKGMLIDVAFIYQSGGYLKTNNDDFLTRHQETRVYCSLSYGLN